MGSRGGEVGTAGAPTAPGVRHEFIDVLRGFALFGVLLSNLLWTTQHFALTEAQREALPHRDLDHLVEAFSLLFVEFKFYTLFSLLFGLGFAMQVERMEQRGPGALATYVRRLLVLLAIGLVHSAFLWFGDILQFYALLGLVLVLFRRGSDRALLAVIVVLGCASALMPFADGLLPTGGEGGDDASVAERFAVLAGDDYGDVVALQWGFQVEAYTDTSLSQDGTAWWFVTVFFKFLLGFWLGRRGLLQHPERHGTTFRRLLPWALVVGLAGNGLLTGAAFLGDTWIASADTPVRLLWVVVEAGVVALAFAYVSGLALLHGRPAGRRVLAALAPVGRMALTSYLTHSALFMVLFYGVGLGWLGEVGAGVCLALALAIFGAQIVLSRWWLARFRFGPMEWLWRCLTYGRWLPLRAGQG